jgi:Tfp pilus assembly ATPase PilU
MNLQEAKKQMRDILDRMVLENAPELFIEAGSYPKIKVGRDLRALGAESISAGQLELIAESIMLHEQWENFISGRSYRTFSFQLLALGIGRFSVEAAGYDRTISLTVKPLWRPSDGVYVPFVPAGQPPSLRAEAIPEI